MASARAAGVEVFVTSCVFCLAVYFLCCPVGGQDQRCHGRVIHINVTSAGVLYSPGYPEEYHNSELCTWILTSLEAGKVLQLRPLDMHLGRKATRSRQCTGDVITAYDDNSTAAKVLHEWCGEDLTVVHSTTATVLLQLRTNHHRRHRGFAIKYSLLTLSDNTCESGQVKTIPLGDNAVVAHFTGPAWTYHSNLLSTCSWRLVTDDVTAKVVIDLDNFDTGLPCEDGNFSVYDGLETSSPEVSRWCARSTKPFTSVYLTGSQGMVVIRTRPNVTAALRFRFYTRPKIYPACSLTQMPTVELKGLDPIFISFPFAANASGISCPLRLLSATTQLLWARVDLLEVDGGPAVCNRPRASSAPLVILQVNGTDGSPAIVPSVCWRGHHPVYWPVAESVIISPSKEGRRLVLQVTPALHGACHGRVLRRTAPTDETVVIRNPPLSRRSLQYSRKAWCRFVISGESEADHVLARVEGELCEMEAETCGDYVRIYDGPSTDSPLLYDSGDRNHVAAYVVSTGRHVTYEVSTDDRDNRGFLQAEFNSVPDTDLCNEVKNVKATRQPRNLSSINYPRYYPVNYMCQYCITAEDPDHVIYIQVIDSDMTYSCSDTVEVYDGSDSTVDADYLGRFCGQDTPRLVSKLPGLCLLFRSDPALHGRGWLLSYRAAPPPSSNGSASAFESSESSSPPPPMTATAASSGSLLVALGVLLAVVTVTLIIVSVVFIIKTKRQHSTV